MNVKNSSKLRNNIGIKNKKLNKTNQDIKIDNQNIKKNTNTNDTKSNNNELNTRRIEIKKFTVFCCKQVFYVIGSNYKETLFRIMEINFESSNYENLNIFEDNDIFYTKSDIEELLNSVRAKNDSKFIKIFYGFGLIGLVKFTKGYYLCLITKCNKVANLGGHYIYHIDDVELIPLNIFNNSTFSDSEEERLITLFKILDLNKNFYFCYSYDISNSLQTNFMRYKILYSTSESKNKLNNTNIFDVFDYNTRFVWNLLLLKPVLNHDLINCYDWFQPIIHGFVDQAKIFVHCKYIYITIIARRSQYYAGVRFLKRGVNSDGNVANEVETEHIVSDVLNLSFHDLKYGPYNSTRYTSFVQNRGSIPLFWSQDLNKLPKPPIAITFHDPFYSCSSIHFNNIFKRYGLPIIILNLIKKKEKQQRELTLYHHFENCIKYLNRFLDNQYKIQFHCFDMSSFSKKNLDVISPIQKISSNSIEKIGFFHNGIDIESTKLQKGVIRTNCIDCLDRTNAAQFIICKEALTYQLKSLNIITENESLDYASDIINTVTEIFHDHGNTIAGQYGGSNLVNTMDSYLKINQWSSHTRGILNSIKRMYSNSFTDQIRQSSIDLFLRNEMGDVNKSKSEKIKVDSQSSYKKNYSHSKLKKSYIFWYNKNFFSANNSISNLEKKIQGSHKNQKIENKIIYEKWFNECYTTGFFESLNDLHQFNMNYKTLCSFSNSNNNFSRDLDYTPLKSLRIKSEEFDFSKKISSLNKHYSKHHIHTDTNNNLNFIEDNIILRNSSQDLNNKLNDVCFVEKLSDHKNKQKEIFKSNCDELKINLIDNSEYFNDYINFYQNFENKKKDLKCYEVL